MSRGESERSQNRTASRKWSVISSVLRTAHFRLWAVRFQGPLFEILGRWLSIVWIVHFQPKIAFLKYFDFKNATSNCSSENDHVEKIVRFQEELYEDDLAFWSFIPQKILDNNSNIKSQTKSRFICYTKEIICISIWRKTYFLHSEKNIIR